VRSSGSTNWINPTEHGEVVMTDTDLMTDLEKLGGGRYLAMWVA
jgi:hypothetical protein